MKLQKTVISDNGGFAPVIIVFVVLIGLVGVYFLGVLKTKDVEVNSTPIPIVSDYSTPSATLTPTTPKQITKWKTYSNKAFTLKYPFEWDSVEIGGDKETNSTIMIAPKEQVDKVKQINGGFGGGKFLTLTINTSSEAPVWKTDDYWIVTTEPVLVGNKKGVKHNINVIKSNPAFEKGEVMISVVVESNGTYYQIDLLDYKYLSEFDQILSTFKFLD